MSLSAALNRLTRSTAILNLSRHGTGLPGSMRRLASSSLTQVTRLNSPPTRVGALLLRTRRGSPATPFSPKQQ